MSAGTSTFVSPGLAKIGLVGGTPGLGGGGDGWGGEGGDGGSSLAAATTKSKYVKSKGDPAANEMPHQPRPLHVAPFHPVDVAVPKMGA